MSLDRQNTVHFRLLPSTPPLTIKLSMVSHFIHPQRRLLSWNFTRSCQENVSVLLMCLERQNIVLFRHLLSKIPSRSIFLWYPFLYVSPSSSSFSKYHTLLTQPATSLLLTLPLALYKCPHPSLLCYPGICPLVAMIIMPKQMD